MAELTDKEKWEQKVFGAFAKCSTLNIGVGSIYSCKPPLPDIRCMISGTEYYFELAEVVPQKQAQALSTKGVYQSAFPEPDELGFLALVNILQQKQTKKYQTGGSPVDLLLYFNKYMPLCLPDPKIDLAIEGCKQLGPFSRIWSYCSWSNTVDRLA